MELSDILTQGVDLLMQPKISLRNIGTCLI